MPVKLTRLLKIVFKVRHYLLQMPMSIVIKYLMVALSHADKSKSAPHGMTFGKTPHPLSESNKCNGKNDDGSTNNAKEIVSKMCRVKSAISVIKVENC